MTDLRGLTLKQLRALASTVRHGTVTGAAKHLHVTPPAITTQLKILEKNIGAPLFDRSADGFVPTEIGRELLDTALYVEKLLGHANDRIAALQSGAIGSVVFAVVSTGKYVAPSIVSQFQVRHPGIRVKLVIGNRGEIIRGLEHNEYDVVIMGRPPTSVAVESALLSDHPHVLVVPAHHRLAGKQDVSVDQLLQERFLAREPGSGTRLLMERFLEHFGNERAFDVVEMGTNETIKQAVMAGLGIAILSAHTCFSELRDGRLVPLSVFGLPLVRQWYLIHRQDRRLTTAAQILKSFIVERGRDLFPRIAEPRRKTLSNRD